jgi:uncharacterized membrane protein YdcZ (DUF606 family)
MIVANNELWDPDEGPAGQRMQPLRPLTLACLGPLLLGVAIAASAGLTTSDPRTVRTILIWFTTGAITGALLFVPIAVLLRFRRTLARRLRPYAFRIQWHLSIGGALGLGYLLGSTRHATADRFTIPAVLLVLLCAWTKIGLSVVFGKRLQWRSPPRGFGGDS